MMSSFLEVRTGLINTYREGYKKRGIPLEVCENDWEHSKRTTQACVALVIGTPDRIEDKKGFPLMGFGHDWTEWEENIPDYTPSCNISPEEKQEIEAGSLKRLREKLGDKYTKILDKVQEKQEGKTKDTQELTYIDKSLAGIGAMEYERLGYTGIADFHPYALKKLSGSAYHTHIYTSLLKSEFKKIGMFTQYFSLLRFGGDYKFFQKEMKKLSFDK